MKTSIKIGLISLCLLFLMTFLLKITMNKEVEDRFEIVHRSQYESDPVFEGYPVYHELRR